MIEIRRLTMLEGAFTRKLLAELQRHPALRGALIWKVSDRFNAGRPDVQIVVGGRTTYFELKIMPRKLSRLQEYYLKQIGARRAYLVNVYPRSGLISIVNMVDYSDQALDCSFSEALNEIVIRCING